MLPVIWPHSPIERCGYYSRPHAVQYTYHFLLSKFGSDVLCGCQALREESWRHQVSGQLPVGSDKELGGGDVDVGSQGADSLQLAASLRPLLPLDGRRFCDVFD